MTPSNVAARKANIIRQHEKLLNLPVNSAVTNGMLDLDIDELEHGFIVSSIGSLRFLPDPVTQHLFIDVLTMTKRDELDHWCRMRPETQASLRKLYRNAGYTVAGYNEKFRPKPPVQEEAIQIKVDGKTGMPVQ